MIDLLLGLFATTVVLLAYIVRGITGFGSGVIAVPLLSLIAPVQSVVPVVVPLDYVGSAAQSFKNLGRVLWREQLALFPFSVIGIVGGLVVLRSVPTVVLSRALGGFVIVYAIYQMLPLAALRGSRLAAIPCGLLGGLVGTLFGTGGPFYAIYFGLRGLDKSDFRATFATNFLLEGALRIAGYALAGLIGWRTLGWMSAAFPLMAVGIYLGGRIHLGLSQRAFVRLVNLILVASGAALLLIRG